MQGVLCIHFFRPLYRNREPAGRRVRIQHSGSGGEDHLLRLHGGQVNALTGLARLDGHFAVLHVGQNADRLAVGNLSRFGIGHAACIDKALTERIIGAPIKVKKAAGQRPLCGCIESTDIGAYDTCPMGCRYCYATAGLNAVKKRLALCDPASPLLCGQPDGREIVRKDWKSLIESQLTL